MMVGAISKLLQVNVGGNELWRILLFCMIFLGALVAGRLSRFSLERAAGRLAGGRRALLGRFLASLGKPALYLIVTAGLWFGLATLNLQGRLREIADTLTRVLYAAVIGYALYRLVDVLDDYLAGVARRSESRVDDMLVPLVGKSIRITILVLVVLQIAQALSDKPIATIITSLGVGGLAVALAGQDTIKNFFGSLVILADKPFEIGDRVVIDGHDGPVEHVGFRSTRIRTLTGHLVTVPNGEMVNKTVENVGKRPHIRRLANITITYDTPPGKTARAVEIIKEILANHEGMRPDFPPRVYFSDFNDWSLNIMVLYWYHPPDYWKYMEFTERVNFEIQRRFSEEGIDFAFPSQTVYLANDDKRQLALKMLEKQG